MSLFLSTLLIELKNPIMSIHYFCNKNEKNKQRPTKIWMTGEIIYLL